jgi:hypothetical protein
MNRHPDLKPLFEIGSYDRFFKSLRYSKSFPMLVNVQQLVDFSIEISKHSKLKIEDLIDVFLNNRGLIIPFNKYNLLVAKGMLINSFDYKTELLVISKYNKHTVHNNTKYQIRFKRTCYYRNSLLTAYITHEFIQTNTKLANEFIKLLSDLKIKIVSKDDLEKMIIMNNFT